MENRTAGDQGIIDGSNVAFWNELCGSQLARSLGITDSSPALLKRFDDRYFGLYPYLDGHIGFRGLSGKAVLEVGLGYGSVSQRIAESGADYHGLDVSPGPVAMAQHRLRQCGLKGDVRQGSILSCPFPDAHFDVVIAVGCYHHTGNLRRAIDETHRVLKDGGRAMVMVYNAYSYRRWLKWPGPTLAYFMSDKLGLGSPPRATDRERAAYDVDGAGNAAPETVFVSIAEVKRMTAAWRSCRVRRENIGAEGRLAAFNRNVLNRTLGPLCGLDLYIHLEK